MIWYYLTLGFIISLLLFIFEGKSLKNFSKHELVAGFVLLVIIWLPFIIWNTLGEFLETLVKDKGSK